MMLCGCTRVNWLMGRNWAIGPTIGNSHLLVVAYDSIFFIFIEPFDETIYYKIRSFNLDEVNKGKSLLIRFHVIDLNINCQRFSVQKQRTESRSKFKLMIIL